MSASRWRVAAAAATVVISAGIGAVTNLVTGEWSVALFVLLVALVLIGAGLQVAVTRSDAGGGTGGDGTGGGPVQRARASRGSTVVQAGRDVIGNDDQSRP
jgi:hypothetical protein